MPEQSFLERLGLRVPEGSSFKIPDLPEGIRNFARGVLNPEEAAAKPKEENLGWQEALGAVLGTGILPMAGITKFFKAGTRIPDVASRMAATERNIDRMIDAGADAGARSDDLEKAIEFAMRYPRTFAHQDVVYNPEIGKSVRGSILAGRNRISPDGERIRIEVGPIENMRLADPVYDTNTRIEERLNNLTNQLEITPPKVDYRNVYPFAHTLAHETQHTGQRLLFPQSSKVGTAHLPPGEYEQDPREKAAVLGSFKRIYGIR